MTNINKVKKYSISVVLEVQTVSYTGRESNLVKKGDSQKVVPAGGREEVRLNVSWDEYGPRLMNQAAFNVSCIARVTLPRDGTQEEKVFEYVAQDDFRVLKPVIKVEVCLVK